MRNFVYKLLQKENYNCPEDVETTKKIASVRIHVERIIVLVRREYRILHGFLPIEIFIHRKGVSEAPIDNIVTICCALVNLCPGVVLDSTKDNQGKWNHTVVNQMNSILTLKYQYIF